MSFWHKDEQLMNIWYLFIDYNESVVMLHWYEYLDRVESVPSFNLYIKFLRFFSCQWQGPLWYMSSLRNLRPHQLSFYQLILDFYRTNWNRLAGTSYVNTCRGVVATLENLLSHSWLRDCYIVNWTTENRHYKHTAATHLYMYSHGLVKYCIGPKTQPSCTILS